MVTNSPYNASALPIIMKLGWQTVNDLIVEETLNMVYKCSNDEAPSYLACLFGRLSEASTQELRNTETDPRVPFLRTTCGQKCFCFREAKLFNGLDAKSKLTTNFKNLNPISKTPEHKRTLFIPSHRELLTIFTLSFYHTYCEFFGDYLFSLHKAVCKAIHVDTVDSFTLFE